MLSIFKELGDKLKSFFQVAKQNNKIKVSIILILLCGSFYFIQRYSSFFSVNIFQTGENCVFYMDKIDSEAFQEGVVVAVIDSGLDLKNKDIDQILAKNEIEIKGKKGVDDDKNGYIDDFYGWDFVNNSNYPHDENGHGTAVSGVLHFNFKNKILPLKITGRENRGSLKSVLSAIEYAINSNAKVINLSVGTKNNYPELEKVIASAVKKWIVVVSAVGNDEGIYYPASYPGVISVGTSTQNKNADINTLGTNICVLGLDNKYSNMGGSSLATPFVAGYISQLLTANINYPLDKLTMLTKEVFNDKKDIDLIAFNTDVLVASDSNLKENKKKNSIEEVDLTLEQIEDNLYLAAEAKIYGNKKLSKYDVVKLIMNKEKIEPLNNNQIKEDPFGDVPKNTIMAKYLAKAKSLKFITADDQNLFHPKYSAREIEVIAMLSDLYLLGDLNREFYLYNKLKLDKKLAISTYLVSAYNLGIYNENEIKNLDYNHNLNYGQFIKMMANINYLYYQNKK